MHSAIIVADLNGRIFQWLDRFGPLLTRSGDKPRRSKLSLSENVSPAELLASLPPEQLAAFLKRTSDRELEAIEHDWGWWGRPNQQAPQRDWRTWLLLTGGGLGKTRRRAGGIDGQVIL